MADAVIPSISIDGLLAARDAMQAAVDQARAALGDATARLTEFGVEVPRFGMDMSGGQYRSLLDEDWQGRISLEIDRRIWIAVMRATNIETLMDSKTREELRSKLSTSFVWSKERDLGLPALTKENLLATWNSTASKAGEYFERAVVSVYRALSWNHKTNTPGTFGERLIVRRSSYAPLSRQEPLLDLERVLCLLDKRPAPTYSTGLRSMPEHLPRGEWTPVCCAGGDGTALMSVKLYSGTAHVRILRPDLIRAMNAIMARLYPGQIGTGKRTRRKAGAA